MGHVPLSGKKPPFFLMLQSGNLTYCRVGQTGTLRRCILTNQMTQSPDQRHPNATLSLTQVVYTIANGEVQP